MKIALIIPQNKGDWQIYIARELVNLRHEILVNTCTDDCDVIIGMTHTQWAVLQYWHKAFPNIPMVTYNWDWYDYIDKTKEGWTEFIKLMKESIDVWSSSKITAKKCEKDTGIKSDLYGYSFVLPWEWEGEIRDWGYVMQASRPDDNKRFNWFIKACRELDIPYKAYYPKINKREDYIRTLQHCSFMVSSSKEESIAGLTLMEAVYNKKPIFLGDHESSKEIWGKDAVTYKTDSYEDYKKQLEWMWKNYKSLGVQNKVQRAYQKVIDNYMPEIFAKKINNRLNKIL